MALQTYYYWWRVNGIRRGWITTDDGGRKESW